MTSTTDTTTTRRTDSSSGPIDPIGAELAKTLRALKQKATD